MTSWSSASSNQQTSEGMTFAALSLGYFLLDGLIYIPIGHSIPPIHEVAQHKLRLPDRCRVAGEPLSVFEVP